MFCRMFMHEKLKFYTFSMEQIPQKCSKSFKKIKALVYFDKSCSAWLNIGRHDEWFRTLQITSFTGVN